MVSQTKRGGGTVCLKNPDVWKSFDSIIQSLQPCPIKKRSLASGDAQKRYGKGKEGTNGKRAGKSLAKGRAKGKEGTNGIAPAKEGTNGTALAKKGTNGTVAGKDTAKSKGKSSGKYKDVSNGKQAVKPLV